MNRKYNLKLDLQFRCNNSTMKFRQSDNKTSDFFIRITNGGNLVDIEKAIVVLAIIKPSGKVASQFVEVENGLVYADLKPNMRDEIGIYTAQAMLILEDERVVTDVISYEVEEDKIFSLLNDTVETAEDFTLLTDMINRLSTIEISEEQRVINEAERILSEENRKIEEAKRVEAELIRQHEEADRAKYDATRESNENIRKQNESIRLANETNRIDEEAKRVEEEAKRVEAEQLRKDNYNFMTEDEDRRRSEANAHKEAEVLRVQAETNRVNEEAKRRTTEQARVSAENTRVSNENTRKANETTRQTNETHRVEAETQRQNRYNSFILEAEANANNFENYTNSAKVKEEERKSNELDRKSQEAKRVSNEVERISNENTRKANEKAREKNETSRQYVFENKVDEVDKKIIEINTTKDNFISSISTKVDTKISEIDNVKDNFVSSVNTKVDSKISELDNTKSDMATSINNKVNEVENRFNALTSKQQQDAEVIDARDGETSLKARLDRDIEKAKQVYVDVEGSHISSDSSVGYAKDVEILGNTVQSASNLADIRSVGDKVEGQELYEIPVLSVGKNIWNPNNYTKLDSWIDGTYMCKWVKLKPNTMYTITSIYKKIPKKQCVLNVATDVWTGPTASIMFNVFNYTASSTNLNNKRSGTFTTPSDGMICLQYYENNNRIANADLTEWINEICDIQLEESTQATPYEPYQEDKLTILSPTPLEKDGDVADRIIEKNGVWGVEKNVVDKIFNGNEDWVLSGWAPQENTIAFKLQNTKNNNLGICDKFTLNRNNTTIDIEAFNVSSEWNEISIRVNKSKLSTQDVVGFKKWLSDNNVLVMYSDNTSTFIPLPHDQQVKLRTFANKTNISFGCEIEGTIKAQVPKSLGATVNTHTEQINNLNKELDRVKKLEESTVSTVTTESDFTTVEATSNGYFQDVKLEGKTLVNLNNFKKSSSLSDRVRWENNDVKNIQGGVTVWNLSDKPISIDVHHLDTDTYKAWYNVSSNSCKVISIGDNEKVGAVIGLFVNGWTSSELDKLKKSVIILEGDHTQNPPNGYIEGLKSVGQSATTSEGGVDEIVVSSVNGDGNLFDGELFSGWVSNGVVNQVKLGSSDNIITNYIKVKQNQDYANNFNFNYVWIFDRNRNFIKLINKNSPINVENGEYAIFGRSIGHTEIPNLDMSNIQIIKGIKISEYTPHQSDKKRLLYYNEETQTWEKPVLREWDNIEKHADGKYYYHQRSGEIVLNGSESIKCETLNDTRFYNVKTIPVGTFEEHIDVICDRYKGTNVKDGTSNNLDKCIYIATNGKIFIKDNSITNEVALKTWLQANNVTVVYKLAKEKVYECTNIDLITYANETNYIVECGAISPKTTLKVHNNISNVVSLLQKKVSLLESNVTSYMITQNRLMLASRYNADTVSFKVDVASFSDTFEYDNDLYELILNNILVGKDNYNREYIENLIRFYWMDFIISDEMYSTLFEIIEEQHNPKIEETPLI